MDISPHACPRCDGWMTVTSSGNPYCIPCDQVWHVDALGVLSPAPPSPFRVTPELERQLAERGSFKQTVQVSSDGSVREVDEVVH